MLALVKLAVDAARKPVQEVPFPATHRPLLRGRARRRHPRRRAPLPAPDRRRLEAVVARRGAPGASRPAPRASSPPPPPRRCAPRGVLYPTRRLAGAVYDSARAYTLKDEQGTSHRAYRLSVRAGLGEYYGIQGTDWTDPPILAAPDERRTLGSRTFELYYDGRRLRRVALGPPRAPGG